MFAVRAACQIFRSLRILYVPFGIFCFYFLLFEQLHTLALNEISGKRPPARWFYCCFCSCCCCCWFTLIFWTPMRVICVPPLFKAEDVCMYVINTYTYIYAHACIYIFVIKWAYVQKYMCVIYIYIFLIYQPIFNDVYQTYMGIPFVFVRLIMIHDSEYSIHVGVCSSSQRWNYENATAL